MPHRSGMDLALEIKSLQPTLPILIISASRLPRTHPFPSTPHRRLELPRRSHFSFPAASLANIPRDSSTPLRPSSQPESHLLQSHSPFGYSLIQRNNIATRGGPCRMASSPFSAPTPFPKLSTGSKPSFAKNINIFTRIDHSGEAQKVGLTMPLTQLPIFGNPKGGTPVMIAQPSPQLISPQGPRLAGHRRQGLRSATTIPNTSNP